MTLSLVFDASDIAEISEALIYSIKELNKVVGNTLVVARDDTLDELEEKFASDRCSVISADHISEMNLVQWVSEGTVLFSKACYYGPVIRLDEVIGDIVDTCDTQNAVWYLGEVSNWQDSALWSVSADLLDKVVYIKGQGFALAALDDVAISKCRCFDIACDKGYDQLQYRSYDLMRSGFPILRKEVFKPCDFDVSMGYQIQQTMEYIKRYTDYDENLIYDDLLRTRNLSDLYRLFHWDFVVPEMSYGENRVSAALVVSLFYADKTLAKNLEYLRSVPDNVDVFIVAKHMNVADAVSDYIGKYQLEWKVKVAEQNRGRDISALLIEAKAVFDKYEYVGFIHDKKTSGNAGVDLIGDDFNDILFENIIGRAGYINNVISLFEDNPRLGLLSAPEIVHSTYFALLGDEWTNDYENTLALADRIGMVLKIDRNSIPYVLGTAFWCRSKALRKLVEYPWKYTDFPEEPLDMDGTLNHAIERILMFVAQDAGFYSGIIQNQKFVSMYMSNMRRMLDETLKVCHRNILFSNYSEIESEIGKNLIEFCKGTEEIWIYGAGGNSGRVASFMTENDISFKGYIVSDGCKNKEVLEGKPIFELSEAVDKYGDRIKVVLSVNKKLQSVIIPDLEKIGIADYFCV